MARTTEELAQDYTAMGHSVDLINAIIAGTQMADDTAADRQGCVDRNVEHLELNRMDPVAPDQQNQSVPAVNR